MYFCEKLQRQKGEFILDVINGLLSNTYPCMLCVAVGVIYIRSFLKKNAIVGVIPISDLNCHGLLLKCSDKLI